MNKKNLVLFIVIVLAMVVMAQQNMTGGGITILGKRISSVYAGRPEVKPPFPKDSYKVDVTDKGITITMTKNVTREYEGEFLSVYAYDNDGRHVVKFKRVVNGRIFIGKDEDAQFIVEFNGDKVSSIITPEVGDRFHPTFKDAVKAGRNYGLERCLLGRQGETICPVYALELVRDDGEYGRIKPVVDREKCIEDGLCTVVCPTRLLYRKEK
ncbi:MAG: 4Fe-4S dicluster domain-containing protein [Candidatus Altiarchaeota archaeon]